MAVDFKQNTYSDFKTQIIQGYHAIQLLESNDFKIEWDYLIKNSVLKSVFQDTPFVLLWYNNNLDNFNPVIIAGYSENRLVALLTLAQKIDRKTGQKMNKLEGAGAFSALFQTWLVLPGYQEIFWNNGIKELFWVFPKAQINLKCLPNLNGIKVLQKKSDFKSIAILEKYQNPVLDYKIQDYNQTLNKRHFRSKYNRLKRAGEVKLEKVISFDKFNQVLKEIATFHDLRQGAAFNINPFGSDNDLQKTFIAWFEKGILYASLLILDDQIIGAIFFINEYNKIMHLAGLVTYSPLHAKYSPGLVHLYLLGLQLQKEGFEIINLSPGYDSYKERFSNQHQEIYELFISLNFLDIFKRKLRNKFRQMLLAKGIRPMDFQVFISKKKSLIKNRLYYLRKNFNSRNQDSKDSLIAWAKKQIDAGLLYNIPNIGHNNLNDLLLIGEFDFKICRWEFLEDALKRLEGGQSFITYVINDKLVLCIWFKSNPETEDNSFKSAIIKEVFVSKSFDCNSNTYGKKYNI
jgi:hypothetical protein